MNKFVTGLKNGIATGIMVCIMLIGVQGFSNSSHLKFVQISDTHFLSDGANTTFKMIAESPKLLDDAVEQVNEIPNVDFVMFTGDLIDKPFEKELHAALTHLNKLHAPWYFSFGNHDVCVGGYLSKKVYYDILAEENPFFKSRKSYYSFVPKAGYKVIVLDSNIDTEVTAQGFVSDEQLKWLDNELASSQKDIVLIFSHIPIVEPFPSPNHRMRNVDKVMSTIEKYKNPIGIFTGHYHAAKVIQKGNLLYVMSPALISYPNAFRVVNITNRKDKVIFDLQFKETRLTNVQKLAKIMVFHSTLYSGEESDRNGIYEIKK